MENLSEKHGYPTARSRLRFLQIRLAANPVVAAYADIVKALRIDLITAEEKVEEAEIQKLVALAQHRYEDLVANAHTAEAVRILLNDCKGDRDAPDFKKVVPFAPSQGTRPTGGSLQAAYIRGIIANGRALPNPSAEFLAALDTLEATQQRMDAAQAQIEATTRAAGLARVERDLEQERIYGDYNQLYFQLNQALPHQKDLVDSFFA
jgi:hypothetical protein